MSDISLVVADAANLPSEQERVVVQLEAARRALADARTVQDLVQVTRGVEVLRQYIKRTRISARTVNEAAALKVEATVKAGAMLARPDTRQSNGRRAEKTLDGLTFLPTLDELGVSRFECHYWQKVASIPAETRDAFYRLVDENLRLVETDATERDKLGPTEVTTAGVLQYWHANVHRTSTEDEWLTPQDIIERTLTVLGAIDLDPCSNTFDAPNVPAARRFTEADDGLARAWSGRVYMNPPYGAAIVGWVTKLRDEVEDGNVSEAVALVPARTDTEWWAALRDTAVCFVRGRLTFSGARNSAPFPSAVAYFGDDRDGFFAAFGDLGDIWTRVGD